MFFDLEILCRARGGMFYLPWIAGVYGPKRQDQTEETRSVMVRISDREVRNADILRLCRELTKYIMCDSLDVKQRISLRLGSILLSGIIRIFQRKVILFQGELFAMYGKIEGPLLKRVARDKPIRPRAKGERKKKRKGPVQSQDLLPFEMGEEIPHEDVIAAIQEAPRAPPEAITLPDDVAQRALADDDQRFGDEQFPELQQLFLDTDFTTMQSGDIEKFVETVRTIQQSIHTPQRTDISSTPVIKEPMIPVVPDENGKKRRRTSGGSQPPKRGRFEGEAASAVELQVETAQMPELAVETEVPAETLKVVRKRKSRVIPKNLYVEEVRKRPIKMRNKHPADEVASIEDLTTSRSINAELINEALTKSSMILSAYELLYEPGGIAIETAMANQTGSTLPSLETSRITRHRRVSSPQLGLETVAGISAGSIRQSSITPHVGLSRQDTLPTITQPEIPGEAEIVPFHSTPKHQRPESLPLSITEIIELPPAGNIEAKKRERLRFSPPGPREGSIIEVVKNWNFAELDLTIEDLCPKPIKRLNIAAIFHDLLLLDKKGYVCLHHKPDSLELGHIELGPKLKK